MMVICPTIYRTMNGRWSGCMQSAISCITRAAQSHIRTSLIPSRSVSLHCSIAPLRCTSKTEHLAVDSIEVSSGLKFTISWLRRFYWIECWPWNMFFREIGSVNFVGLDENSRDAARIISKIWGLKKKGSIAVFSKAFPLANSKTRCE